MTLSCIDPREPFQSEYRTLIREVVACFQSGLGAELQSLYLYGSVARKTARLGESNIDVIVVTHSSEETTLRNLLNTLKWRIQKYFPHVRGISMRTAQVSEVLNLDSLFTWGFMLRHCSVCVYGESLAESFGNYEPSWEIAKHWNIDVDDWVSIYREKIAQSENRNEITQAQRAIAKKLLRASYSLIMHKDKRWFDEPIECGNAFLHYHPEKAKEVERLVILLSGREVAKRSVVGLIDSFGQWLIEQYKRTEFKIG